MLAKSRGYGIVTSMKRCKRTSCLAAAVLCLAAGFLCVASAFAALEADRARSGTMASMPTGFISDPIQGEYYINAGDLLEIFVWKDPDLTKDVRVRPDGKFTYPLIGTVQAAGLTVEALQDAVREKLTEYVKFPHVTVTVKDTAMNKVIVLGEVGYPGVYPYRGSMDILTAVGLAGDFTPDGKRESVLVVSDNFTDHPKVRRVNVFRSFRHGAAGKDFLLKPNDIVYVPKTFIGDLNKSLNDLQPAFNTFNSVMGVRTNLKTLWYNVDKPVKQSND